MSTLRERRLGRMPSAQDIVSGSSSSGGGLPLKSPLAQVKSFASSIPIPTSGPSSSASSNPPISTAAQPSVPSPSPLAFASSSPDTSLPMTGTSVPAPNFNLFRTTSVYSVSSDASDLTISSSDNETFSSSPEESPHAPFAALGFGQVGIGTPSRPETPTTPRGVKSGTGYFDSWDPAVPPHAAHPPSVVIPATAAVDDGLASGQITPKKSFVVRSRPAHIESPSSTPPIAQAGPGPTTLTSRSLAETHAHAAVLNRHLSDDEDAHQGEVHAMLPNRQSMSGNDWESIHGEQGSEWGEDEATYEWLDTDQQPSALNGDGDGNGNAAGSSKMRLSPSKRLLKLAAHVPGLGERDRDRDRDREWGTPRAKEPRETRKLKKPIVVPRRAAPPPPPGPGSPQFPPPSGGFAETQRAQPTLNRTSSSGTAKSNGTSSTTSSSGGGAAQVSNRQALQPRYPNHSPRTEQDMFSPPRAPAMIPLSDGGSSKQPKLAGRNSHLSVQTGHFSLYEIDSPSPGTPRAGAGVGNGTPNSAGSSETVYASGTYRQIPASALRGSAVDGNDQAQAQGRSVARSPSLDSSRSNKEGLLSKGLEARAGGDLAKAAWYFRQSADAGSPTGRMYWGLALRHGWGVAKDDRKAFVELRQACDESLASEGVDMMQPPGSGSRSGFSASSSGTGGTATKKALSHDLSMGIFEVANCFLEGIGVKKSPEVAVSYLRFAGNMGDIAAQEQLGFLLSKGGNGIKKDMKEAARWYRKAINQGSTNTFGLAWVWKDKYND